MRPLVYFGGTFDLFHAGHLRALEVCSEVGEVWVGLNTDQFAAEYKRRPIVPYEQREEMLLACRHVSNVVPSGRDSRKTFDRVLAMHGPRTARFVARSSTWPFEAFWKQTMFTPLFLQERGALLLEIPYTESVSTSDLIERCKKA